MCQRRTKRMKKVGSGVVRQREARRLQRLQPVSPSPSDTSRATPIPPRIVDVHHKNQVLMHLALRTVALMQRNTEIQQKIVELQRETTEFVACVMSTPENRRRYNENLRMYSEYSKQMNWTHQFPMENDTPIKTEPDT